MYRGSIPQYPLIWRCCAPLYIAKLQDKALCRLNTRLQKEFTRENIKLKIFGKSVVRAWRNRGFKGISQCKRHIAKFSQCELLMMRSAIFSHHELIHLAKFSQGGSSWCEVAKFRTMKKISLRNFRNVKFTLRNWSFDMMQLPSKGHIFLISAPNHTRFEALDF